MTSFSSEFILKKLQNIHSSLPRLNCREELLSEMKILEKKGLSCIGCSGVCCTFEKNSMKVTPLEAIELTLYLTDNNLLDEKMLEKINGTIKHYRLDQDIGDGSRLFIRRNYTCPFFQDKELGCMISPLSKPYGCLAFNSYGEEKEGGSCKSDTSSLQRVSGYEDLNRAIRDEFSFSWQQAYIPIAIRDTAFAFTKKRKKN